MINAKGSIEYLTDQIHMLERLRMAKGHGGQEGWDMDPWTEKDEEKLGLLEELIKYKKLYHKVSDELYKIISDDL